MSSVPENITLDILVPCQPGDDEDKFYLMLAFTPMMGNDDVNSPGVSGISLPNFRCNLGASQRGAEWADSVVETTRGTSMPWHHDLQDIDPPMKVVSAIGLDYGISYPYGLSYRIQCNMQEVRGTPALRCAAQLTTDFADANHQNTILDGDDCARGFFSVIAHRRQLINDRVPMPVGYCRASCESLPCGGRGRGMLNQGDPVCCPDNMCYSECPAGALDTVLGYVGLREEEQQDSSGLPVGAIIAIVAGVLCCLAMVAVIGYLALVAVRRTRAPVARSSVASVGAGAPQRRRSSTRRLHQPSSSQPHLRSTGRP
jgi:hypothetical protein